MFILFLMLFSLDIFEGNYGFWGTVLGLFMHNIPALVLAVVLLIAWKREWVGGIAFILGGIFYSIRLLITAITTGFQWYYLSWGMQISGIAFLIGIMFFANWFLKRK